MVKCEGTVPDGPWPSGRYFGDGSGGRFSSYPALRRCGIGLAYLENEIFVFGACARLNGEWQTVPRAETSALLILVDRASYHAHIEFVTDNKYVKDTFAIGADQVRGNVNADLFYKILSHIKEKS